MLGLDFDWDVIEEQPGEQILGGLDAAGRKILLNETHADLFEKTPGLLRSTIGHEAGHYDIDIDRAALLHPALPGAGPVAGRRQAPRLEDRQGRRGPAHAGGDRPSGVQTLQADHRESGRAGGQERGRPLPSRRS